MKVQPSRMISASLSTTRVVSPRSYRNPVNVLAQVGDGLWNAFRMAWEVWWALVLGFLLSAIVQAWAPRDRLERALGGRGPGTIALATGLGAASSSCSYAAVAIAKSLFQKGASLASAMVFQFASTNLVFELGIVIWIFLGWQFTLAELAGGLLLIVLMWAGGGVFVSRPAGEPACASSSRAARRSRRASTRRRPTPGTSTTRPPARGSSRCRAGRTSRTTSA